MICQHPTGLVWLYRYLCSTPKMGLPMCAVCIMGLKKIAKNCHHSIALAQCSGHTQPTAPKLGCGKSCSCPSSPLANLGYGKCVSWDLSTNNLGPGNVGSCPPTFANLSQHSQIWAWANLGQSKSGPTFTNLGHGKSGPWQISALANLGPGKSGPW